MPKAYRGEPPPKGTVPDLAHALAVTIGAVPAFAVDTRPRLNPVLSKRPLRPGESLYVDMGAEAATTIGPIRPVRRYEQSDIHSRGRRPLAERVAR